MFSSSIVILTFVTHLGRFTPIDENWNTTGWLQNCYHTKSVRGPNCTLLKQAGAGRTDACLNNRSLAIVSAFLRSFSLVFIIGKCPLNAERRWCRKKVFISMTLYCSCCCSREVRLYRSPLHRYQTKCTVKVKWGISTFICLSFYRNWTITHVPVSAKGFTSVLARTEKFP